MGAYRAGGPLRDADLPWTVGDERVGRLAQPGQHVGQQVAVDRQANPGRVGAAPSEAVDAHVGVVVAALPKDGDPEHRRRALALRNLRDDDLVRLDQAGIPTTP